MQDAPKVPPNDISLYSYKRASEDIRELAKQLGVSKIVLGGHDWYVQDVHFIKKCSLLTCYMTQQGRHDRLACGSLVSSYDFRQMIASSFANHVLGFLSWSPMCLRYAHRTLRQQGSSIRQKT